MATRLNHNRPLLAIAHKVTQSKYGDRNQWISTRQLMKAKSWDDVIKNDKPIRVNMPRPS